MDEKQISRLLDNYKKRYNKHPNLEIITSSNVEVMVCKYNILNKYNTNKSYLIDRFNNKYIVKYKDNLMYIYDYKKKKIEQVLGINNIRINQDSNI